MGTPFVYFFKKRKKIENWNDGYYLHNFPIGISQTFIFVQKKCISLYEMQKSSINWNPGDFKDAKHH